MEPSWFFGRLRARLTATVKKQGTHLDKKLVFRERSRTIPTVAQWRRLPQLLNRSERRILMVLFVVLLVSGAVALFSVRGGQFAFAPGHGGRWIEGEVGAPREINPILMSRDTDRDIASLVYSGLLRETTDGTFVPDLAERFDISPEGTRYTITVRKGVLFHDGEPFSVEDVLFTYRSIADPAWRSPYWKSLKDVQVTSPDADTVVFALGKPFPAFTSLLAIGLLPEHVWKDVTPATASHAIWNIKPIGTGPFQFDSLTRTSAGTIESMELVRNEKFYQERPHLDRISLRFYSDLPSMIAALTDGRVHGAFIPARHTDTVFAEKRFRATSFDVPSVVTLFMNGKNAALTKEARVAVSQAIDRAAMLKTLDGGAVESFSPIPMELEGPAGPSYGYDVEAATSVLSGGKSKKPLSLDLVAPADPFYHDIVEALEGSLKKAGAEVNVRELGSADFLEAVHTRSYDLLLWSSLMPYGVDLYPYWHSGQVDDPGLNFSAYRNRKVDTVLEKLRGMTDPVERMSAYADVSGMLRTDVPAIFLVSPRPHYVAARRLHGELPRVISFPARRFAGVREWSVKRQIAW